MLALGYSVHVVITVHSKLICYCFYIADADLFCLQLKLMATVHQTQPNIQMLLATSDYVGALDLISATQDILTRDLAGIQSFRCHLLYLRHM